MFPIIKSKLTEAKVIIAGRISHVTNYDCMKLGEVTNLKEVYEMADVVVSPVLFGTGLKIKNIESLGFSKPLVTTTAGAEGLEDGIGKAFFVANVPEQFAEMTIQLLTNDILYSRQASEAYHFAKDWNTRQLFSLTEALK